MKEFFIKYTYLIGTMIGGVLVLGGILNWKWIANPNGGPRGTKFIYNLFGEKGLRIYTAVLGAVIMAAFLWLWHESIK